MNTDSGSAGGNTDSGSADADQHLDARGLNCPLPLLKTRQALRHLAPGQTLEVVASDAGSVRDIPEYIRQSSHQLVRQGAAEVANGITEYHFLIRCGEGGAR